MKQSIIIFFLCFSFIGCGLNIKPANTVQSTVYVVPEDTKLVYNGMTTLPDDVLVIVYKQFCGMSEYMRHAGKDVDNTVKVFKMIDSFQTDYSYPRGKYVDFARPLKVYLTKYEDPKVIVNKADLKDDTKEIAREYIISDMQNLANAAKLNLESRNAKSK
jgi:hypothetical protein